MLKVKVEDIMSDHVITIPETATVGQAAHLLMRYRVNAVFVVKKNNRRDVMGIVTTEDLLEYLDEVLSRRSHRMVALQQIGELPIGVVANREVIKVAKDTKLARVIGIMHRKNAHTILIYDYDKLVGVLGRHDILNAAFTN